MKNDTTSPDVAETNGLRSILPKSEQIKAMLLAFFVLLGPAVIAAVWATSKWNTFVERINSGERERLEIRRLVATTETRIDKDVERLEEALKEAKDRWLVVLGKLSAIEIDVSVVRADLANVRDLIRNERASAQGRAGPAAGPAFRPN